MLRKGEKEGKKEKAIQVLDKSLEELPKLERKLKDAIGHTDNLTFSDLETVEEGDV